jgi:hypothetical protein
MMPLWQRTHGAVVSVCVTLVTGVHTLLTWQASHRLLAAGWAVALLPTNKTLLWQLAQVAVVSP